MNSVQEGVVPVVRRVLIVGLGSIGLRHTQVIRDLHPEMIIAVLRHGDCCDEQIKSLTINHCFTSMEEALSFQPDIAVIANPASMHIEEAFHLAESGVHILIEKPISSNVEGVQRLINVCSRRNVKLMIGYNLRFLPSLIIFRKYLQQGKMGTALSVRAEVGQYLPGWRPDTDYRQTVSAQHKLGGGVLLELSHEVDYLSWLFGTIEWVKAYVSKQSKLEIDVEDSAHLIFGFKNYTAEEQQLVATLNMDFIRHDTVRQCIVIGDKGSLRWDAITGKVTYFSAGSDQWEELYSGLVERDYTYREEIKDFITCVETDRKPLVCGEEGMETLNVIEAARESSNTGSTVYIMGINR